MKISFIAVVLFMSWAERAICQIPQSSPEFCGMRGQVVSIPRDVSADRNPQTGEAELFVRSGAPAIRLPLWDRKIDQVCPLPDGRLLVFGSDGTNVIVIDTATATLVDSFLSYNPVLSPDKKWVVFLKFYPRSTELPSSDEYLLYDLSKGPAQNRPSGVFTKQLPEMDAGKAIYPMGWKNESGDNIGAPADQQHGHSSSFFWSPDSKALAFSDSDSRGGYLVHIALTENGDTTALLYPLSGTIPCADDDTARGKTANPTAIRQIDFGPQETADQLLYVHFEAVECTPKTLQLHTSDFRPAPVEPRTIEIPTRKAKRIEDRLPQ